MPLDKVICKDWTIYECENFDHWMLNWRWAAFFPDGTSIIWVYEDWHFTGKWMVVDSKGGKTGVVFDDEWTIVWEYQIEKGSFYDNLVDDGVKEYYDNIDRFPYAKKYFEINWISATDVVKMAREWKIPVVSQLIYFDMDVQHEIQCWNMEDIMKE